MMPADKKSRKMVLFSKNSFELIAKFKVGVCLSRDE